VLAVKKHRCGQMTLSLENFSESYMTLLVKFGELRKLTRIRRVVCVFRYVKESFLYVSYCRLENNTLRAGPICLNWMLKEEHTK
jgi:hypothetical protein